MKELRNAFEDAMVVISIRTPYISSFAHSLHIVSSEDAGTAYVDDKMNIVINPNYFLSIDNTKRVFVIAHETLHIAFMHPFQLKKFVARHRDIPIQILREAFNIAADAVVNEFLYSVYGYIPHGVITFKDVYYYIYNSTGEQIDMSYSVLDIAEELLKTIDKNMFSNMSNQGNLNGNCNITGGYGNLSRKLETPGIDVSISGNEKSEKGEELNKGSSEIQNLSDDEEREQFIKDKLMEMSEMMKMAGASGTSFFNYLTKLLKPEIPWYRELNRMVKSIVKGNIYISTFKRLNRKYKDLPGYDTLNKPDIWALVDVSSSISDDEFNKFMSELLSLKKYVGKLTEIDFSTDIEMIKTIKTQSDVKRRKRGGGTDPTSSLKYVLKNSKMTDVTVILTDGWWYYNTQEIIDRLRKKTSGIILVTTEKVPVNNVRVIKIKRRR